MSDCDNYLILFRKNYSKYGLESRLHFRIHSVIEVLKLKRKGGEVLCNGKSPSDTNNDLQTSSDCDVLSEPPTMSCTIVSDDIVSSTEVTEQTNTIEKISLEESSVSLTSNDYESCTSDIDETLNKLSSRSSDSPVSEASSSISPLARPKNKANEVVNKVTSL